jgi:hypothetical protein
MLLIAPLTADPQKQQARDWQSATVVEVFPPESQKRAEPKSIDLSAATHKVRQSPYPVYSALGGNTRWIIVFESGDATYVGSAQALRGDSSLRTLKPGDTVGLARQGKKDLYVRLTGKADEKLYLLEARTPQSGNTKTP